MILFIIANLLLNGDFEEWSGGLPTYWSSTSSVQMTQNTDTVFHSGSSNRIYFTSTSTQIVSQGISGISEDSLYVFTFFVYDNDPAGRARVCVVWYGNGSYISGVYGAYSDDKPYWQVLSTDTLSPPTGADSVSVQIRLYDVSGSWDGDAVIFVDRAVFSKPSSGTDGIVINEIMYNPPTSLGDDAYYEWVEIVNPLNDTVNITYWKLIDNNSVYNIPAIEVPPGEFVVFARNSDSIQSVSEYSDDILNGNDQVVGNINLQFSNSGEVIWLRNADSTLIDSVPYDDSSPWPPEADGSGPSAELIDPSYDNTNGLNWLASTETYGTPGEGNSVYDPPPTIEKIWRNPYVPEALQPDTFRSIITDNGSVDTAMFYYWLSSTGFDSTPMENENGDTFMCVINGESRGTRLDSFFIKAVDNGGRTTYSDTSRGFFWGRMDIHDLRVNDANGSPVYGGYEAIVSGVVTAGESTFAQTYLHFYIQDSTGGIACHHDGTTYIQSIYRGDSVKVIGTITSFAGETELNYVGPWITKLGTGTLPNPDTITISDMGESYEGKLVVITNVDTSLSSPWPSNVNTLDTIIDVDGDSGLIWIDSDTDLDGWGPDWGTNQNIQGILRQYDTSSPYTSGYEIAPRGQSDFSNILFTNTLQTGSSVDGDVVTIFWKCSCEVEHFTIKEQLKGKWILLAKIPGNSRSWSKRFSPGIHKIQVIGKNVNGQIRSRILSIVINPYKGVEMSIFPNSVYLVNKKSSPSDIKLFDISGRTVLQFVLKGKETKKVNLSQYPSGLYFILVDNNRENIRKLYNIK